MTRRDKDKGELLSETAPGPSELTRQFADDPGHVPAGKLLDELAAENEREHERQAARETLLAPYEGSVPGPPMIVPDPDQPGYNRGEVHYFEGDDAAVRAAAEWNRAETRQDGEPLGMPPPSEDEMIRKLVHHEQAKPVYEQCPDKGTCHHGCGDGPCFRVLHAGPLSGRYEGDVWPQQVKDKHLDRAGGAAAALAREPKGIQDVVRGRTPVIDVDLTGDYDVVTFRLRSGDVIHAFVDPMDGTLVVENRVSNLAVFPVSPNRAKVM